MISKRTCVLLLLAGAAIITLGELAYGPIPQPQSYHNFADKRDWLGIENVANVISSAAFAFSGVWGLYLLFIDRRLQFNDPREKWPWVGVSIGLILTALGSGYYHLDPDNNRLVWDRLPMTLVFMSYVSALICERVGIRSGLWLWPALILVGFLSVIMWHLSELKGMSDLRFYLGVQEFAIYSTFIMLFTESPYNRNGDLAIVLLFYGLARVFEIYDQEIYVFSGRLVSGHTLKHFSAAAGGIWLIRMISRRKLIKKTKGAAQ